MLKFCKAEDFVCCPGDPIKITYSAKVLDDGTIQLTPSGKVNTDELINAGKDSCDINKILKRMQSGDMSALDKFNAVGEFFDSTQFPSSYRELLQFQIDSERHFDELPVELKNKFNNNFREFMLSYGSKDFESKLSEYVSSVSKVETVDLNPVSEVKKDE